MVRVWESMPSQGLGSSYLRPSAIATHSDPMFVSEIKVFMQGSGFAEAKNVSLAPSAFCCRLPTPHNTTSPPQRRKRCRCHGLPGHCQPTDWRCSPSLPNEGLEPFFVAFFDLVAFRCSVLLICQVFWHASFFHLRSASTPASGFGRGCSSLAVARNKQAIASSLMPFCCSRGPKPGSFLTSGAPLGSFFL